jgi:CRISPR-associated exonuclease Cas4
LKGVTANQKDPGIVRGNKVDENTYSEESETQLIDGVIAPDILSDGRIKEVKPSSSSKYGAKMQLLFYLFYFEYFKSEKRKGVLLFPKERKRVEVELDEKNKEELFSLIERAYSLWNSGTPPELEKKDICSACAYQDFCWQ